MADATQRKPRRQVADPLSRERLLMELGAGLLAVLVLAVLFSAQPKAVVAAALVYSAIAFLIFRHLPGRATAFGWANRVTLLRGVLVCVIAGGLFAPNALTAPSWPLAGLALTALILDGVDGWVARLTATASTFGARFDMELDAGLILVLCLALADAGRTGAWVLAVGAMRYGFVLAGWRWRWLSAELPESRRRKAVCVWQVIALMLAVTPLVSAGTAVWLAASALATLTISFAVDVGWLYRRAPA